MRSLTVTATIMSWQYENIVQALELRYIHIMMKPTNYIHQTKCSDLKALTLWAEVISTMLTHLGSSDILSAIHWLKMIYCIFCMNIWTRGSQSDEEFHLSPRMLSWSCSSILAWCLFAGSPRLGWIVRQLWQYFSWSSFSLSHLCTVLRECSQVGVLCQDLFLSLTFLPVRPSYQAFLPFLPYYSFRAFHPYCQSHF